MVEEAAAKLTAARDKEEIRNEIEAHGHGRHNGDGVEIEKVNETRKNNRGEN